MKSSHRFNKDKIVAGKHFYYDLMKRHPDISLRVLKSISIMRAVEFITSHKDEKFLAQKAACQVRKVTFVERGKM